MNMNVKEILFLKNNRFCFIIFFLPDSLFFILYFSVCVRKRQKTGGNSIFLKGRTRTQICMESHFVTWKIFPFMSNVWNWETVGGKTPCMCSKA